MNAQDRAAIDDLFAKIAEVARRSGPRDGEAESYIRALTDRQPGAAYYMAQTIVAQEQALNEAQRRIEELEAGGGQRSGGGFLDSIFGGSQPQRRSPALRQRGYGDAGPWGGRGMRGGMGGGGFLAGAAQTAMGVAGGVMLGNMLADWLTPDQAAAGEAADAAGRDSGDGWFGGGDNADLASTDTDLGDAGGSDFGFDV